MKSELPTRNWLIWCTYLLFFVFFIGQDAQQIFSPQSQMNLYYRILLAYDIAFWFPYLFNVLAVIFSVLSIVPIILYMLHIRWLPAAVWKVFFGVRVFVEIMGHSYEAKFIQAIWYQDPAVSWLAVSHTFIWLLPSYIILYLYAFQRKHLLAASS
ncbi:MAG: hypothetical protein ACLFPX_05935 [Candidatus Omnitrophota bacterium]